MQNKKLLWGIISTALTLAACDKGSDPKYYTPGDYLPAYPGSYWDYSDGSRTRATNYELHNYRLSTTSNKFSDESYVPIWDGKSLYTYSIYQDAPLYPLKQLLAGKSSGSSTWVVDENNGEKLKRCETHLDSLIISNYTSVYDSIADTTIVVDTIFEDICQVVEYMENKGYEEYWNTREFYAKNVGLIRVDVNNPYDTLNYVIQKEIRHYFINK